MWVVEKAAKAARKRSSALQIVDRIEDCAKICNHRAHSRTENLLSRVAIHRCSFSHSAAPFFIEDEKLDAAELASRFAVTDQYAPGYYTKGTLPYTFLIKRRGVIEQCLPIHAISSHALRWNVPAIGIAIVGDMRTERCTKSQWEKAIAFCALWKAYGLQIFGHDELPFAITDRRKKCPGAKFNMNVFRREVKNAWEKVAREAAKEKLVDLGAVF